MDFLANTTRIRARLERVEKRRNNMVW